jgi:predicted DNA repair protein MutK
LPFHLLCGSVAEFAVPVSAFFSLLRDATKLAAAAADDVASQSAKLVAAADDVASMAGNAAVKTAGVAGDDLAVGAGQVAGVSPNRELPALWRISKGSLFNKVWLAALLLVVDQVVPVVITGVLLLGALYLAYEGGETLLEMIGRLGQRVPAGESAEPELSEDQKVKGAIRTDMVLSFEMLVIALTAAGAAPLLQKVVVLAAVGLLMTVGVYGLIALLIRLDDMGLALTKSAKPWRRKMGRKMVNAAPVIIGALGPIGMVAMFAVAGGILTHAAGMHYPNWMLGTVADISLGVAVGALLAGAGHWLAGLRK